MVRQELLWIEFHDALGGIRHQQLAPFPAKWSELATSRRAEAFLETLMPVNQRAVSITVSRRHLPTTKPTAINAAAKTLPPSTETLESARF